ncbi:hypothetical protein QR680_008930 [Steinernema hermaphroditum]|uniref:RNA-directed RNA polymerase n=1 Tax=Steinernema hermaphroditum TaxID=289476 RepID=A0AA39III1_9BILA|nr:hypothetical protein QR680_008930 [Steinernema hermaphroditum]
MDHAEEQLSDNVVHIVVEAEMGARNTLKLDGAKFRREVADQLKSAPRFLRSTSGPPQMVTDPKSLAADQPPFVQYEVKVESENWREAFFFLCHNFLKLSKQYRDRNAAWSLLKIGNRSLLKREFQPADCFIPLESVSFGNMPRPFIFTEHYNYDEGQSDLSILRDYYHKLDSVLPHSSGLTMDFHHDQGDFFVKFGVREDDRSSRDGNMYRVECVYMLKVHYSRIRRIIVDFERFDDDHVYEVRLHLLLNNPVEVRRSTKRVKDGKEYFQYDSNGERYLTWKKNRTVQDHIAECLNFRLHFKSIKRDVFYNILSRLRHRCNVVLEFAAVEVAAWKCHVPRPLDPRSDHDTKKLLEEVNCFSLNYLIEALCSRGAIVNDHFLASEETRDRFVQTLLDAFRESRFITLATIERMLNTIDENLEIRDIVKLFQSCHEQERRRSKELEATEERQKTEGFLRVRKVVITPTRILFVVPEMMMGNKFLREFDPTGEHTLRVQFRDDSGRTMTMTQVGDYLIEHMIRKSYNGIIVAGREFKWIGASNSQMRDHGCYFIDTTEKDMRDMMKENVGNFDDSNDPIKSMARFGQRFTQARAVEFGLTRNDYHITADITGGLDPNNEPYTFSDGVGSISVRYAKHIAEQLKLHDFIPSVYQIRFRGMKGIVTLNPNIDHFRDYARKYGINERRKYRQYDIELSFRDSQNKFHSREDNDIDIVKYSTPTPMQLNRPMINIMDQVTAMQNEATHKRLVARVHQLLDLQLNGLGKCLTDEHRAREKLSEMPRRIDIQKLSTEKGFYLTEEPFFRSLLQCNVQYAMRRLRSKNQVAIPFSHGRMMFGVIDETGGLQYGQIFCQITNNLFLKTPGVTAAKTILKGPVLMTKNPQNVAGDMRMFQAVDIPELHHLVDVVVFPRYGPRPHPDQMAGSDLDGDEYALMWDPELFFDRNEDPIDFPKPPKQKPDPKKSPSEHVIEHIIKYIKLDSIGTISYAFLVNSDLYGIDSEVCLSIARKHSMAVDFPKNGTPPDKLTTRADEKLGIPAEKPDRYPDFMEKKDREPEYVSANLNGQLYRRSKEVESILLYTMDHQESRAPEVDPEFEVSGWRKYEAEAHLAMRAYNASMRAILDNYGVKDEAQLFTGAISNARNRLSDRDNDDMSMFNTNYAIEQRVSAVFQKAREDFFEACGGYQQLTVVEANHRRTTPKLNEQDTERRVCKEVTLQMKQRASAYYQVCYGSQRSKDARRILSFPWVAFDVLAEVKKENYYRNLQGGVDLRMGTPLLMRLDKYVQDYAKIFQDDYKLFLEDLAEDETLLRYCTVYQGLSETFFLLDKFGHEQKIFGDLLCPEYLFYLLILFAVSGNRPFFEKIPLEVDVHSMGQCDLHQRIGGLGRLLMDFFEYLSTRAFREKQMVPFEELGVEKALQRELLPPLVRAASHTFYRITFSGMFFALPQLRIEEPSTEKTMFNEGVRLYELDPFVIEVPPDTKNPEVMEAMRENMQKKTGLHHLVLRVTRVDRLTRNVRVLISGVGTLEARDNLRELVSIKPNMRTGCSIVSKAALMADMVYSKIMGRPNSGESVANYFRDAEHLNRIRFKVNKTS